MPLILDKDVRCSISGKPISRQDHAIGFPMFESSPDEPEFVCAENIVLRNEFEKWAFKDRVVEKVRRFCVNSHRNSKFFRVVAEDEFFLVVKSLIEDKVSLFFLKHVFALEMNKGTWKDLCRKVTNSESGNLLLDPNLLFSWERAHDRYTLSLMNRNGWPDTVEISAMEWTKLKLLLSSKGESVSSVA